MSHHLKVMIQMRKRMKSDVLRVLHMYSISMRFCHLPYFNANGELCCWMPMFMVN